jgi:acyl carrier protein
MLDALAHLRRRAGLPALSINWGLWENMRHTTEEARRQYEAIGLQRLTSDRALDAMRVAIGSDRAQWSVASIDWAALKNAFQVRRLRPSLDEVGPQERAAANKPATNGRLVERLLAAHERARMEIAVDRVRKHVAEILGTSDPETIPSDQGLFEMGMDSLMSVELKNRLERELGQPLPSTITFNYPCVRALAGYLVSAVVPSVAPTVASKDPEITQMSEDELATLLSARLERASS